MDAYQAESSANMKAILANRTSGCMLDNVIVKRNGKCHDSITGSLLTICRNALSLTERIAYTDAVLCLKSKDPLTPPSVSPGTLSRFDDFQATHVNQSSWVHWSVYFLPWHRYLMHSYQTALRDECGYTGSHPYWDWSLNGGNISAQAMFSGAVGSLGSNGLAVPHGPVTLTIPSSPPRFAQVPAGTGGGCITNGPFIPLSSTIPSVSREDFRPTNLMANSQYANVTSTIASANLDTFMVGMNGLHGNGHTSIGGLQGDLFTSNGDPVFYLHHAQVDRVWSIWQGLDFENRKNQVTGTLTLMNTPPSELGTIDTVMDLGFNGGSKTAGDLASTIDGDMCYIYG
ncbi:hypothetical protein BKA61DRAFT_630304 [Leptodontidium sp. MPI-SDFR-AT-0119]|nr:hypothetical protein BKA61DRAFT_630304 [Leptodontidium sp. MPI-SDFR-AT-0119]